MQVSGRPKEPCSRISLLCTKCHFCTPNWVSPPKSWALQQWAQPWLSDLGFTGCLMGLYSSISLSNTGPQSIQASTFAFFVSYFYLLFYIVPFVELASCALLINSVFVQLELSFLSQCSSYVWHILRFLNSSCKYPIVLTIKALRLD